MLGVSHIGIDYILFFSSNQTIFMTQETELKVLGIDCNYSFELKQLASRFHDGSL